MKKITLIQKSILVSILGSAFVSSAFGISQVEGQLQKITIEQCNALKTKCLRAKADKAIGSKFSTIHYLSKIEVKIFDSKGQQINQLQAKAGYLDPELQRLVLNNETQGNEISETLIDLTSLKIENKVMK
jgi:hypothetical protein